MRLDGATLLRNTGYNVVGRVLPMLVAAIAIPLLMAELGPSRFGILALAWVLTGYFTVFDLGLGEASTKYVAEALGRGQHRRIGSILHAATLVQGTMGVVACVLLWFAAPLLGGKLFSVPRDLTVETIWCFRILALSLPAVFAAGSLRGALGAVQRFDLVNAIAVPMGMASFLLPLLGVALGWDLPAIVALLAGSRLLGWWLFRRTCHRLFSSGDGEPGRLRLGLIRTLLRFGGWTTVSSVVGPILVYADRLIIGSTLTVAAVGLYAAPYEILARASLLIPSLAAVLLPAFSALDAAGMEERALRLFSRAVRAILLVFLPALGLAAVYAPNLLSWWLGDAYDPQQAAVFRILAVGFLLNGLAHVPYTLLKGTGHPDVPARFHLLELPVHVLLLYLLMSWAGLPGAALAWSLRAGLDMVLLWSAPSRLDLARFVREAIRSAAPSLVVALVFLGAAAGVRFLAPPQPWEALLIAGGALSALMLAWRFGLEEVERLQVIRLLRRGLRREVGQVA
jgi:O-antigen/teichoic acid export membrane protein